MNFISPKEKMFLPLSQKQEHAPPHTVNISQHSVYRQEVIAQHSSMLQQEPAIRPPSLRLSSKAPHQPDHTG